jgi:predicted DNA-binding transcriptional regulator AlpA
MTISESSQLLPEHSISQRLGVSVACLRRWRMERRGPAFIHLGRLVRYRVADLESWLDHQPRGGEQTHRAEHWGAAPGVEGC